MFSKNISLIAIGLTAGLLVGAVGARLFSGTEPVALLSSSEASLATTHGDNDVHAAASPTETSSLWCAEHEVPESLCTRCNPSLIPAFKAKGDWCEEHQLPESGDRLCHPELTFAGEPKPEPFASPSVFFPANSKHCATDDALVQFASAETTERAGITFAPAQTVNESATIEAPAELLFDDTKSFALTARIPTTITRWLVEPGQTVKAGQPLAELDSPEMPGLVANYLDLIAERRLREKEASRADSLARLDMISRADAEQTEHQRQSTLARLSGARGILEACGLDDADISALTAQSRVTARWKLRAPTAGFLLERQGHPGELVAPGTAMATIGDPRALWAEAQVRESDLARFHQGQVVEFSIDGNALHRVTGQVIWVAQFVDPLTRSATVRARVSNPDLNLKAHQFGRMALPQPSESAIVAVPRDAVQWEGCCNVVFVQESPNRYRPHKVSVARGDHGYYNISSGLNPGDLVVVKGSYLLKTELKKGSLGAGCCAVAPKS